MARNKSRPNGNLRAALAEIRSENARLRRDLAEHRAADAGARVPEGALGLSLEQVADILANAGDAILVVDLNGTVIYVNKKVAEVYGDRDVLGKRFVDVDIFGSDSLYEKEVWFHDLKALMQQDNPPLAEVELLKGDGTPIYTEVSSHPLRKDGQVWGMVVVIRDISDRKKAEERLRELYAEERKVRQEIEAEMKRRLEFMRAVAHELKTPLTPILASIETLTDELKDERSLKLARNIAQGASALDKRVDELLDLARGEVGMLQLRLESTDLRPMLRAVADNMTPLALSNGLSLIAHLPPNLPKVRADITRLEQVLTNLMHNAIKFTPRGGKVTLSARDHGANIIIEVKDTGPGLSETQKKHIFEPYRRADQGLRVRPYGMGLGLALCKMFIDLHEGQIWVRSRLGKGSTFGFSLPVETPTTLPGQSDHAGKLWKVLIIEDNPQIVNSISLALESEWPHAALLSTRMGEEGVDLVATEHPDVVVLDLGLPDRDGLDVLQEIRLFSSVPVVVLTVRQEEQDITRALSLGANDYITKPFKMKELLARLKVQVRRQIPSGEEGPIVHGPLRLDPSTFELTYGSREISLTVVEGHILRQLMLNAGRVVTYGRLAEAVWGDEDYPGAVVTLRTYIRQLRQKLQPSPSDPKIILTKPSVGYSLVRLA
ncbi:MAG: response regulator [Dehalococcoidia bacterium]|nr:response regulator [Dehalococcoidia bacterium]